MLKLVNFISLRIALDSATRYVLSSTWSSNMRWLRKGDSPSRTHVFPLLAHDMYGTHLHAITESFPRACVATRTSRPCRMRISVGVAPCERQHARSIPTRQDTQCTLRTRRTLRYAAVPVDPETNRYLASDSWTLVAKREVSFIYTDPRVLVRSMFRACTRRSVHSIPRERYQYQGQALRTGRLLSNFRDQVLLPRSARLGDRKMYQTRWKRLAGSTVSGSSQNDAEKLSSGSQTNDAVRNLPLHRRYVISHHHAIIIWDEDER